MKEFLIRFIYYILYSDVWKVPKIQASRAIVGVKVYKYAAVIYNNVDVGTNKVNAETNHHVLGQKPITTKRVKTYNNALTPPLYEGDKTYNYE